MPLPPKRSDDLGSLMSSKILDLPSLLAAFKKTDIGWALSREQIIRAAEPEFRTPEMNVTLRKRSSLVGLLRNLVIYDPGCPDHDPAHSIRGNKRDADMAALSKQIASILRHKEQGDLMDEGGWMDIHTVCFILQNKEGASRYYCQSHRCYGSRQSG